MYLCKLYIFDIAQLPSKSKRNEQSVPSGGNLYIVYGRLVYNMSYLGLVWIQYIQIRFHRNTLIILHVLYSIAHELIPVSS